MRPPAPKAWGSLTLPRRRSPTRGFPSSSSSMATRSWSTRPPPPLYHIYATSLAVTVPTPVVSAAYHLAPEHRPRRL